MAKTLIVGLIRCVIAALFIYAGALKVSDAHQFAFDVEHYRLTSPTASVLIAIYLPWLEIIAGLALLARRLYLGALAVLLTLTLIFIGALGSAWWRGLDISCGCFAEERPNATDFRALIFRDLLIFATLCAFCFAERARLSAAHRASDSPGRE